MLLCFRTPSVRHSFAFPWSHMGRNLKCCAQERSSRSPTGVWEGGPRHSIIERTEPFKPESARCGLKYPSGFSHGSHPGRTPYVGAGQARDRRKVIRLKRGPGTGAPVFLPQGSRPSRRGMRRHLREQRTTPALNTSLQGRNGGFIVHQHCRERWDSPREGPSIVETTSGAFSLGIPRAVPWFWFQL